MSSHQRLGSVFSHAIAAVLLFSSTGPAARADVKLPSIFTDHVVLQQQTPIVVWGTAAPEERVTVTLADQSARTTTGADGKWKISLPALKADGKPRDLSVRGNNTVTLKDVLLGEVWLCSGQSNMGRPVESEEIKSADFPQIRLFNSSGATPRHDDLDDPAGWFVCTPESIKTAGDEQGEGKPRRGFTQVGYCFGKKLHQTLQVPVGLIQANCGGSTAKDWTPPPADVVEKIVYDEKIPKLTHQNGLLYWIRLRPLTPLAFRGVVWYQGEDDGRNPKYGDDLKELILSWRRVWNRDDLPFYFAQIAQTGYAGGMLGVWDAQVRVMQTVPHTGLAVSNDIYDGTPISAFQERVDGLTGWLLAGGGNPHPTGKPRVAARLADIALVKTYGQPDRTVFGPIYNTHEIKGDRIVVKFKYAGEGLATRDGKAPDWFEISDGTKDKNKPKFVKAEAKVTGPDTVEVWSADVPSPKFVRFAWNTLARHNLINKSGLPAVSFSAEK